MAETTFDELAKQGVKQALVDHVLGALRALSSAASEEARTARSGQEDVLEADDLSQSDEASDLAGELGGASARTRSMLAQLDGLDFSLATSVRPGAIVGFDGDRYVVGVACDAFDCDGVDYEGIALDSPIYPRIEASQVGDTFVFNGTEHRIDFLA